MCDQVPDFVMYSFLDDDGLCLECIPHNLRLSESELNSLWEMHPCKGRITVLGVLPFLHYQQAYGADYHFSGQTIKAEPVPKVLRPALSLVREEIEPLANGIVVSWYDASPFRFIIRLLRSAPAPFVTASYRTAPKMRGERSKGSIRYDFELNDGSIIVSPIASNSDWAKKILRRKSDADRRISIAFCAFDDGVLH